MTANAVSPLTASIREPPDGEHREPYDAPQAHMTANAVSPLTASIREPLDASRQASL